MMSIFYNLFYRVNNDQTHFQQISQKWQHSWTLAKILTASLLFMSSVKQREMRTGSTGCEYLECIIVNWVSPLSSTFNPVAVSFPPAKSCLFKWRPARRPQPWRSAVTLHLISHKWADWENFLLLFPLQDEAVFCLNSYPSGGVVRLDVPVGVTNLRNISWFKVHSWVDPSKCLKTNRMSLKRSSANVPCLPWGVIGLCLACFRYPPDLPQIAGRVASVTFSVKRCWWGAGLLY